ncbi:MAG: Pr6Pr family membrane protein [Nocardioidaceae bacterium]
MTTWREFSRFAKPWHLLTALISAASLITQIVLVVRGVNVLTDHAGNLPSVPERLFRFFSYFTVQSNILVIITALSLVLVAERDGRLWRVLRLDAMVGITVTLIVYHFALAPLLDLRGVSKLTDTGFHYVTPILAILGWLAFGPRPRFDVATLWWSLVWPALYFLYSIVHGENSGWYPYPFIDVGLHGYPTTLRNALLVCLLLLGVGTVYLTADAKLRRTPPSARPPSNAA